LGDQVSNCGGVQRLSLAQIRVGEAVIIMIVEAGLTGEQGNNRQKYRGVSDSHRLLLAKRVSRRPEGTCEQEAALTLPGLRGHVSNEAIHR
jgi:hypothetical protein